MPIGPPRDLGLKWRRLHRHYPKYTTRPIQGISADSSQAKVALRNPIPRGSALATMEIGVRGGETYRTQRVFVARHCKTKQQTKFPALLFRDFGCSPLVDLRRAPHEGVYRH